MSRAIRFSANGEIGGRLLGVSLRRVSDLRAVPQDRVEVCEQQLGFDDLEIAHRIDPAVDVDDLLVREASNDMHECIGLPDVSEKLIAQPLPFARPTDQAGDVGKANRCQDRFLWLQDASEPGEPRIIDRGGAYVSIDRAERIVRCLRMGVREGIQEGGFADIRQADDPHLERHFASRRAAAHSSSASRFLSGPDEQEPVVTRSPARRAAAPATAKVSPDGAGRIGGVGSKEGREPLAPGPIL